MSIPAVLRGRCLDVGGGCVYLFRLSCVGGERFVRLQDLSGVYREEVVLRSQLETCMVVGGVHRNVVP